MDILQEGNESNTSNRDAYKLLLAQQLVQHPCLWDRTNAFYNDEAAHADAYLSIHDAISTPLNILQMELIDLLKSYNAERTPLILRVVDLHQEQGREAAATAAERLFASAEVPEWVRVLERRPGDRCASYPFVSAALRVLRRPSKAPSRFLLKYLVSRRQDNGERVLCDIARFLRCPTVHVTRMWASLKQRADRQLQALAECDDRPTSSSLPLDWLLIDVMILYEAQELPVAYDAPQRECEIYWLVLKHRLEGVAPAKRREAWLAALQEHCTGNRASSVVLLQRRWHELKRRTRDAAMLQLGDQSEELPPLYVSLMRSYPHLAEEQPDWHSLVASDSVLIAGPVEDLPKNRYNTSNNGPWQDVDASSSRALTKFAPPIASTVTLECDEVECDEGETSHSDASSCVIVLDSDSEVSDDDLLIGSGEGSAQTHPVIKDPKLSSRPFVLLRHLEDINVPVPVSATPAFMSGAGREVKPVRLPRIEDVRRLNSSLLTAQVAPSPTVVVAANEAAPQKTLLTAQVAPSPTVVVPADEAASQKTLLTAQVAPSPTVVVAADEAAPQKSLLTAQVAPSPTVVVAADESAPQKTLLTAQVAPSPTVVVAADESAPQKTLLTAQVAPSPTVVVAANEAAPQKTLLTAQVAPSPTVVVAADEAASQKTLLTAQVAPSPTVVVATNEAAPQKSLLTAQVAPSPTVTCAANENILKRCLLMAQVAPSVTAHKADLQNSLLTKQVAPSPAVAVAANHIAPHSTVGRKSKMYKAAPCTTARRTYSNPRNPCVAPSASHLLPVRCRPRLPRSPPPRKRRVPRKPPPPPVVAEQQPPPAKVVSAREVLAGRDPRHVWLVRLDGTTVPCRLDGDKMLVTSSDVPCKCPSFWTAARPGRPSQLVKIDSDARNEPGGPRTLTPPSSVVTGDALCQRLSISPLVYVRVLTALPNVDAARTVIARGGNVYKYDTGQGSVERLTAEELDDIDDAEPQTQPVLILDDHDGPERPKRVRIEGSVDGADAAETCLAQLPEKPIEFIACDALPEEGGSTWKS